MPEVDLEDLVERILEKRLRELEEKRRLESQIASLNQKLESLMSEIQKLKAPPVTLPSATGAKRSESGSRRVKEFRGVDELLSDAEYGPKIREKVLNEIMSDPEALKKLAEKLEELSGGEKVAEEKAEEVKPAKPARKRPGLRR